MSGSQSRTTARRQVRQSPPHAAHSSTSTQAVMTSRPVGKPNGTDTATNSTPTTVSSRAPARLGRVGDGLPRRHRPRDRLRLRHPPQRCLTTRKALDVPR